MCGVQGWHVDQMLCRGSRTCNGQPSGLCKVHLTSTCGAAVQGYQAGSGALQGKSASYLRDWRPQTEDAASTSEDLAGLA